MVSSKKISEALEILECNGTAIKREILTQLLREHGIGIASLEEMKARTIAIARGEFEPEPDEPKLWFISIESMVECLWRSAEKSED